MIAAASQDGTYPRPQLVRDQWQSLDGDWEFAFDDEDAGLAGRWSRPDSPPFALTITVPFSPESSASGIGDTGYHSVVWYRRSLTFERQLVSTERVLLHFGAVDHSCRVWVDGVPVGDHEGGQSSFEFDVTDALDDSTLTHVVVVRALDDPQDLDVPRGKQDWEEESHAIWYTRTTGIWQSVWFEIVPVIRIAGIRWTSDLPSGTVTAYVALSNRRHGNLVLRLRASVGDRVLVQASVDVIAGVAQLTVSPAGLRSGQTRDPMLWSPENPVLFDAQLELVDGDDVVDRVGSYFGVRSVSVDQGAFQLNGVPYFVRAVLEQGYWPSSLMTAPDNDARRREVQLIKELGFNTARIHQKVEDPRFLYWADRLGLMIWGESGAAYDFTSRSVELLSSEWAQIVKRDVSHPSIVVWVPLNESWGVQDISRDRRQREYAQSLVSLTRALDPSRPAISNDGWEHVDSDIFTVHDYSTDPAQLGDRYGSVEAVRDLADLPGPQGRELSLSPTLSDAVRARAIPVIVSEFGGVSFSGDSRTWGYALADSDVDYRDILSGLFGALNRGGAICGFCYTQFSDTAQEANGLVTAQREPKLPIPVLREIVTGHEDGKHVFIWPPRTGETEAGPPSRSSATPA